jgi:succinyl-CoA synthetase beta subunit
VCILSHRAGDTILFYHEGGIDIGDVDAKVRRNFRARLRICKNLFRTFAIYFPQVAKI